eukprot:3404480-Ditylum_brightwellii.AAC.1
MGKGKNAFKRQAIQDEVSALPHIIDNVVQEVVKNMQLLEDSMEISGKLGVTYGPMISCEEYAKLLNQNTMSICSIVTVYRSRHTAYYKRLTPGTRKLTDNLR